MHGANRLNGFIDGKKNAETLETGTVQQHSLKTLLQDNANSENERIDGKLRDQQFEAKNPHDSLHDSYTTHNTGNITNNHLLVDRIPVIPFDYESPSIQLVRLNRNVYPKHRSEIEHKNQKNQL